MKERFSELTGSFDLPSSRIAVPQGLAAAGLEAAEAPRCQGEKLGEIGGSSLSSVIVTRRFGVM